MQHESYIDVRARQDTEFASGVDWKDFLLVFIMHLSNTQILGQDSLVAL